MELLDVIINKRDQNQQHSRNPFVFMVFEFCLAERDHEILTSEGFLNMYELFEAHHDPARAYPLLIAGYDHKRKSIVYERAARVIVNAHREKQEMVLFESNDDEGNSDMSLLVTPEHDMFAKRARREDFEKVKASELMKTTVEEVQFMGQADAGFCGDHSFECWLLTLEKANAAAYLSNIRGGEKGDEQWICTESESFRDLLVRLCLHAGFSSRFERTSNGRWKVYYAQDKLLRLSNARGEMKRTTFTGRTWCVTVPHGMIIARRTERDSAGVTVTRASRPLFLGNCGGGDFSSYLKRQPGRKLSEAKTRHWMTHLKNGLQFLNKQKILHRDLKPQNLLLSTKDEDTAVLKLADFGFARFIQSQSMIETVCGTPLYMAPEILRSEKYALNSDLWSVGCIVYQCLVGRAPFVVKTHFELIMRLEKEEAQMPQDIRLQISTECYDLIMKLLDKNRNTRISWEQYFNHPWFGVEQSKPVKSSFNAMEELSTTSSSSSSQSMKVVRQGGAGGDDITAGSIIDKYETMGRLQRVADRALAVLELADMKMDHSKPDEACILYWKGLDCLANAIRALKEDPEGAEELEALVERLKIKLKVYQDRARRLCASKRLVLRNVAQLKPPTELMLEFSLQMGRDGGVSEILRDFTKAEKLYSNGAIILEQLLAFAPPTSQDRVVLVDALQKFAQRIAYVNNMESSDEF